MHPKRDLTIVAFMIAGTLTALAAIWDGAATRQHDREEALALSRQIASQAEGLALQARERGTEADPIHWAVELLSQSPEPRVIQLSDFQGFPGGTGAEDFRLDVREHVFEYTRTLTPEDGKGIRLQLRTGYRGFLGTRHVLTNDLVIALFFAATYVLIWFAGRRYFHGLEPAESTHSRGPNIGLWLNGAKAILTSLGIRIRETIRQAQTIAVIAGRSRTAVNTLQATISRELASAEEGTDYHRALTTLQQQSATASEAFHDFFKQTKVLSQRISETTAALVEQSRHIQELTQALQESESRPKDPPTSGPESENEPSLTDDLGKAA
ncbi:MAG: hypothetical protein ACXWPM_01615 [Bdellovibrionota bacterium]